MENNMQSLAISLLDALDEVVLGKRTQAKLILAAWLAQGHVLLNDVPGVAKTRLARSLAALTGLSTARVQGTPDLLPQDITGGPIYDMKNGDLVFRPGPAFHNILLMDEINRATPRTQSALLECMEERQVTADGQSHTLPEPFLVIATQNPIEMEGTFPLPEAELDRFLISLSLGYPSEVDEQRLVQRFSAADPISQLKPLVEPVMLQAMTDASKAVLINDVVRDYIVALCRATRTHPLVELGASPRTSLRFAQLARSYGWLSGTDYATPDHVKFLAPYVLGHRLVPNSSARVGRINASQMVEQILSEVAVPVEDVP